MAKEEKKQSIAAFITPRSEDFSQWYTDVIIQTQLCAGFSDKFGRGVTAENDRGRVTGRHEHHEVNDEGDAEGDWNEVKQTLCSIL